MMKIGVGKLRTTIHAESLEAQIIVNSALRFEEQSSKIDVDNELEAYGVTPETVAWVLKNAEPPVAARVSGRVKTRRAEELCSMCDNLFTDHADDHCVECDLCKKWYALSCVGVPAHLHHMVTRGIWYCPPCQTRQ